LRSLPRSVFETGGSFVWTHGHFAQCISKLERKFAAKVFLLGDFCEAFSKLLCAEDNRLRRLSSAEEFVRGFDQARPRAYRPTNRNRTLSLLNPEIRCEVEAALSRDIQERYRRLSDTSSDARVLADHFFRWESAATISTFFMFLDVRSGSSERNLMFDRDLHELLEILPSDVRDGRNLGALLVRRLAPRAAKVVNSNTLLPLCWPAAAHRFTKKCKPFFGRARRLVLGDSHRTTGSWTEKAALYAIDPGWRKCFDTLFGMDDLFPEDLFDRTRVRQCWSALVNGDRGVAGDVEKLAQLGILNWMRRRGSASVLQQFPSLYASPDADDHLRGS
jgi:hypothetical protein